MSKTIAEVTIEQYDPDGPRFKTVIWIAYDELKTLRALEYLLDNSVVNGEPAYLESWIVKSQDAIILTDRD